MPARIAFLIHVMACLAFPGLATGQTTRDLARINWMEFQEYVPAKVTTVLLPLGTLEAHGVTANGADILAPVAIARAIAPKLDAFIAPVVPYGITGGLDAYPGSFTVPEEAYRPYIRAVLLGLAKNKFRNIILINGHGGPQTAVLNAVAAEVGREAGVRTLVINWWSYASDVTLEVFGQDGGHAGENENAFMMAIDPESGVLFANQMHAAQVVTLIPRDAYARLDADAVRFPDELYPQRGAAYAVKRSALLSSFGAPCNPPRWGTLTAVDLRSGEVLWKTALGTTRDAAPWPFWMDLGAPNLGGAIATAGGLVFVAATLDKFIRAFDARTGDEVWTQRLPFTGNATPMTYRLREGPRQYLVIAAGGHGWSEPGDALLAFALPE